MISQYASNDVIRVMLEWSRPRRWGCCEVSTLVIAGEVVCMHARIVCECDFVYQLVNAFLGCMRIDAPCLCACTLLYCELFQFDVVYGCLLFDLDWCDLANQCVCTDLMFHITHEDAFTQVRTSASRHHVIHARLW